MKPKPIAKRIISKKNIKSVNKKSQKAITNIKKVIELEQNFGVSGLLGKISEIKNLKTNAKSFTPDKSTVTYLKTSRLRDLKNTKTLEGVVKSVVVRGAEARARPEELLLAGYTPTQVAIGILVFENILAMQSRKPREKNCFAIAFSKTHHQVPTF
jgi:hypothetical protein